MKNILDIKNYLCVQAATGYLPFSIVEHDTGTTIYKGKDYITNKQFILNIGDIYEKQYNKTKINDLIYNMQIYNKFYFGIFTNNCIVQHSPTLDIVFYPGTSQQTTTRYTNIPTFDFKTYYIPNHDNQPIIGKLSLLGINGATEVWYRIRHSAAPGGQLFKAMQNNQQVIIDKDSIITICTNIEQIKQISGKTPYAMDIVLMKNGRHIKEYTDMFMFEDTCKDSLYVFNKDQTIDHYYVNANKLTLTNEKLTMRNISDYEEIYKVKEGIQVPIVIDEKYNLNLLDKLNNNYGVFLTMIKDGTPIMNYGTIQETSITQENHKQAFTLNIK